MFSTLIAAIFLPLLSLSAPLCALEYAHTATDGRDLNIVIVRPTSIRYRRVQHTTRGETRESIPSLSKKNTVASRETCYFAKSTKIADIVTVDSIYGFED